MKKASDALFELANRVASSSQGPAWEKLAVETSKEEKYPSCIGCGYCCRKSMCSVGIAHFGGRLIVCPALVRGIGQYRCALAEKYKNELAIGEGCSSSLNSDRKRMRKK